MTMKSKSSQYPFIIPLRSWNSVSTILEHVNKGKRKHYCPYGMKNPHLSIHFHCLTFDQPHLLHILSACNLSASSTSHESIFTYLLSNQAYKSLYALHVIDLFHLRRTSILPHSSSHPEAPCELPTLRSSLRAAQQAHSSSLSFPHFAHRSAFAGVVLHAAAPRCLRQLSPATTPQSLISFTLHRLRTMSSTCALPPPYS